MKSNISKNKKNINLNKTKKKSVSKNYINIEEHFGLVHSCCQRFRGRGVEYEDIFQTGCIGLTKAVNNFDFNRGVQFSTYAVPVILGEIKEMFRNNCSLFKVSRRLKELSNKIRCEREKFLKYYEREPTLNEISELLNVESEQILEALEVSKNLISLDSSLNEESGSVIEVPIEFDDEKLSSMISVRQVINTFAVKDKNLIYLRFFKGITQSETAKNLGMTQVQVSRREKLLLKMLREKLA